MSFNAFHFKGFFALISFFFPFIIAAQHKSDLNFKGSIRYIIEESYEGIKIDSVIYKNGKNRQFAWIEDNKMEFDKNMNLTKRIFFDDDKSLIRQEFYSFDNDKIIKKGIKAFTYIYRYDGLDRLTEELIVSKADSSDMQLKHRYKHNEKNLLSDIWEFNMQGGYVRHQKFQYDSKNRITKETIKYKDGLEYKSYTYNQEGNLAKMEWYDFHTGLLERTTYSYYGKRLTREFYESFDDGKPEYTIEYKYDEFENPVWILEINEKRKIHDLEINQYEYDLGNNWIKRTTSINDSQFYIVERRIRYYI